MKILGNGHDAPYLMGKIYLLGGRGGLGDLI